MSGKEGLSCSAQMIYLWLEAFGGTPVLARTAALLSRGWNLYHETSFLAPY